MDRETVDPTKLFSVEGMVVVITGGHTGIGLIMTKAFAKNGAAKVYIVGRRKDKLEEAARETSLNGNVVPIVGDVTSKESLRDVAEQVKREVGFVNLLCCNSGTYPKPIGLKSREVSLEEYADRCMQQSMDDWNGLSPHTAHRLGPGKTVLLTDHVPLDGFATNTTSVAFTTFAFLRLLDAGNKRKNSPGRTSQVLVTSSIAGYLRNPDGFNCYTVTKAAATHMVKCLAGTLTPYSIRVNALAPGLFLSDLAASLIPPVQDGQHPTDDGVYPTTLIPAQRTGATSDMAGTVLYLASAAGAYVNGNVTVIDGGRLSILPSTY